MPRRRKIYKDRNNRHVTRQYLDERRELLRQARQPISEWIEFCEHFIKRGYHVALRSTHNSRSKYVTLTYSGRQYRVRFSDHPETHHGAFERTDFFVGVGDQRETTTTLDAIMAAERFFGDVPW